MNRDVIEFLRRNGISPDEIRKRFDCNVKNQSEINRIVYDYGFQVKKGILPVSIADVVGYSNTRDEWSRDVFETLGYFFDSEGTTYHRRSLGMFSYNKDNIIQNLSDSFRSEPLSVCETGEGSYTIFTNGLHRFTILRALYLKELLDANGNMEEIERIRRKYTIPAEVTGIDLDKTYCKYILSYLPLPEETGMRITDMGTYYDEVNYRSTNKTFIRYIQNGEMKRRIIDDEEFIELAESAIGEALQGGYIPFIIKDGVREFKSFRSFMGRNFPELKPILNIRTNEGEEHV